MPGQRVSQFAGGVMGLVGGAVAAIFAAGATAGFLWLFVFGDDPWPHWAAWIVAAVAVTVLVAGIVLGAVLGRRLKPWVALLLASLALAGAASAVAAKVARDRAAQTQAENEKTAFARLAQQSHKISGLRAVPRADKSGWDIVLEFSGTRQGAYRLRLELRRGNGALLSRESQIELPSASAEQRSPLELTEVINAYEGRVFTRGARNLGIAENVELECSLEPLLTAPETSGLSHDDVQNLRLGYSPLLSKKRADLKVEFVLR